MEADIVAQVRKVFEAARAVALDARVLRHEQTGEIACEVRYDLMRELQGALMFAGWGLDKT